MQAIMQAWCNAIAQAEVAREGTAAASFLRRMWLRPGGLIKSLLHLSTFFKDERL